VIAKRAVSGKKRWFLVHAIKTPIKKPPRRFAAKVPKGIEGKIGFSILPNHQRSKAPIEAPMQIDKTAILSSPQQSLAKLKVSNFLINWQMERFYLEKEINISRKKT
jgi:hypothetical protein